MQAYFTSSRFRLLVATILLIFGCDTSVDSIKAVPTGNGDTLRGDRDRKKRDTDELFDKSGGGLFAEDADDDGGDDDGNDENGTLFGQDAGEDDGDGEPAEIVFPDLDFKGDGFSSCKGKNYTSIAGITTSLSKEDLDINMHRNRVIVDDKAQDKADQQIARSRGHTIYDRVSDAELKTLKDNGFNAARFAIFAHGVEKQAQQQKYQFSDPLPVFPWPAPIARYEDLDDGPMSWSASVTGHQAFRATITISKESSSGTTVRLKMKLDIEGDTNGAMYEEFPIPREATYTINTEERDVREIDSTNWYFGNESCDSKARETVKMVYKLCKKTTEGEVEDFGPCQ